MFLFRAFLDPWVPCGFLYVLGSCRWNSPPANAFQRPLHFLGTKKGQNTENLGVLRYKRPLTKKHLRCFGSGAISRGAGGVSVESEVGESPFGTGVGESTPNLKPVGMDRTSGESLNNKNDWLFVFRLVKDWKKSPRYWNQWIVFFFFFFVVK